MHAASHCFLNRIQNLELEKTEKPNQKWMSSDSRQQSTEKNKHLRCLNICRWKFWSELVSVLYNDNGSNTHTNYSRKRENLYESELASVELQMQYVGK